MVARKQTRTKARNGAGYVSRKPRKDGRYEGSLILPHGRKRSVYGTTFDEAEQKLQELRGQVARKEPIVIASRVTLARYLDHWLDTSVEQRNAPATIASYRGYVERHIKPSALGRMPLGEIRKGHIESFLAAKAKAGLSPRTCQYLAAIIRRALNVAVDHELLARNPAARRLDIRPVTPKEITPMTAEDARALIEAVRGSRHEALIVLTLSLGLRNSEALGLRWQDVDLDRRTVTIRGQFVGSTKAGWNHTSESGKGLKTEASKDTLALSPHLVALLTEHRQYQRKDRLRAGRRWQEHGAIFTNTSGAPLHTTSFNHVLTKLLRDVGLPHLRVHDLRHGCGTLLHQQGADLAEIAAQLRHASLSTTRRYVHRGDAARQRTAERMAAILTG